MVDNVDELKKMVLKLDFLLDRMMSVSINSDYAARVFTEHDCRALLRDISNTWCEVNKEHEPMLKTIGELEYEYMVKINKEREVNYPPPIEAGACEEQAIVD